MRKIAIVLVLLTSVIACKSKADKLDSTQKFVSARSLILADIKKADSSLSTFRKITKIPGGWDTVVINRSELRKLAQPIVDLPDISDVDLMDHYQESDMYDDVLNQSMLTFVSKDKEQVVQSQTFLLSNSDDINSQVNTIIIKAFDKGVTRNITWQTGKSFQMVSIKAGKTDVLSVKWE